MGGTRGYDIFPRTFKARVLLALAFLGGIATIGGYFAAFFSMASEGFFQVPPCSGSERSACLEEQTELLPDSQASCAGSGPRVCFVPLGQVDPDLVRDLAEYYRDEYGLEIGVLTPSAVPAERIDAQRGQIEGVALAGYLKTLFPEDVADPDVTLIGLTPLDMFASAERSWRFALGCIYWSDRQSRAVVSTYRMHLGSSGLVDAERVEERTRKLVTKYLGRLHYGIFPSNNPTSPMYDNILSVSDLDRMREPLAVP